MCICALHLGYIPTHTPKCVFGTRGITNNSTGWNVVKRTWALEQDQCPPESQF